MKKRSAKLEEKGTPHTHAFFQETYDRLEKLNPEGKVNESMLKQELVTSGNFTAGEGSPDYQRHDLEWKYTRVRV